MIMRSVLAALLSLALVACSGVPKTNAIDATSATINSVSIQLDRMEAAGLIDDLKEDDLQRELLKAHRLLRSTAATLPNGPVCRDAVSQVECAELILIDVLKFMEGLDYANQ